MSNTQAKSIDKERAGVLDPPDEVPMRDLRVPVPVELAGALSKQARHARLTRVALIRAAVAALVGRPHLATGPGSTAAELVVAQRLDARMARAGWQEGEAPRTDALLELLGAVKERRGLEAELRLAQASDPARGAAAAAGSDQRVAGSDLVSLPAWLRRSRDLLGKASLRELNCVEACERLGL